MSALDQVMARLASLNPTALTHWGRVTHICVGKLTIIGRRQAIIWTNAGVLLIGPLGTNFGEILTGIQTFPFKKMHLKMSSGKWRPFCLGLNVLKRLDQQQVQWWTGQVMWNFFKFSQDIMMFFRQHITGMTAFFKMATRSPKYPWHLRDYEA